MTTESTNENAGSFQSQPSVNVSPTVIQHINDFRAHADDWGGCDDGRVGGINQSVSQSVSQSFNTVVERSIAFCQTTDVGLFKLH